MDECGRKAVILLPKFIVLWTKMMYGCSKKILTLAEMRLECATVGIRAWMYCSACFSSAGMSCTSRRDSEQFASKLGPMKCIDICGVLSSVGKVQYVANTSKC